ncbi:MAG: adenylyltransferase/cytidyltransferase family protein [Chitinophagaceae bacterium]
MIVGITFSCFDVLHAGHLKMLEEAKKKCDYLIVGLQIDPTIDRPHKNKPIQSIVERYIQLKSCRFVDEIVPYLTEEDLLEILQSFDIHIRIIGEDYVNKDFSGKKFCEENNIAIHFNSRKHPYSSTYLKNRIKNCI